MDIRNAKKLQETVRKLGNDLDKVPHEDPFVLRTSESFQGKGGKGHVPYSTTFSGSVLPVFSFPYSYSGRYTVGVAPLSPEKQEKESVLVLVNIY